LLARHGTNPIEVFAPADSAKLHTPGLFSWLLKWVCSALNQRVALQKKMNRESPIDIRFLQAQDIEPIVTEFRAIGWNKPAAQYQQYLFEQENDNRLVLIAFSDKMFVGYLTVVWNPDYPPFRENNIPEIQDLNVLPQARRRGVGTQLMEKAEQIVAQRSAIVGIGVGMDADYGAAQRLYVRRGYVPDGRGLVWHNQFLRHGEQVTVDDNLILHFVKTLTA
jgi:GNAT superfamily N-acetyltransferase